MNLSGFGSTWFVRFFWFCSCGRVGKPEACPCRPQGFRRRADLSGVFRISDRSVLVIAADAAGSMEEGVRAVGIDVDLDPRLDEVRAHRAFGDLELEHPVGDAIVVHACRSS